MGNNKRELWPVEPNIFYYNVEEDDPAALSSSVHNELRYFLSYLYKAIDSMDIEKYGLEWEKDENIQYRLFPCSRLRIKKPKKNILLMVPKDEYKSTIVLMKSNQEQLKHEVVEVNESGVQLILDDSEELIPGEPIYYGFKKVQWVNLSSGFTGVLSQIRDKNSNVYNIISKTDDADSYTVNLDSNIPNGTDIFINDIKVEYSELNVRTLIGIKLKDKSGELNYSSLSKNSFTVTSTRKIVGNLLDEEGRKYTYREDSGSKDKGVMVILRESEDEQSSADDEQRSKIDLFFELLMIAKDFEVWERTDVKDKDRNGRIKIIRIEPEESRIFLESEPKTKIIYPPKATQQLFKQLNAVETLMYRPSPYHRGLLKIFEPYNKVNWDELSNEFNDNNVKWKFLTNINRDGTNEQRKFVVKSMNTPEFALLEGPPGSGKTTAISELIYQLVSRGKRVLLSASTHVAIDNVLEKLDEKYKDNGGLFENGIVPLRIGREKSVSEDIKKFQIDNRKEQMAEIFSKQDWFSNAAEEDREEYTQNYVIWSSNIVCGTTIGILQYPNFWNKRRDYVVPEFDYLIIDEASKTTFQEFLVPAIHAKKWIIVGDVHQLSPFTDTLHVRVNLNGILDNDAMKRAQMVFLKLIFDRVNKPGRDNIVPPKFIFVDDGNVIFELLRGISGKLIEDKNSGRNKLQDLSMAFITNKSLKAPDGFNVFVINEEPLDTIPYALLDIDLIVIDEEIYKRKWWALPVTHILIYPNEDKKLHVHEFRHNHWVNSTNQPYKYKLPGGRFVSDHLKISSEIYTAIRKDWANELAWRMKRVYELQLSKNASKEAGSFGYYQASMHALMPPEQHGKIWKNVRKIGQVALPSILSSIQDGVTKYYRNEDSKTVLSHGLGIWPDIKGERHEKLSYQYRMHPSISKIPREMFYDNVALKDGINDDDRSWPDPPYDRYKRRAVWIDVDSTAHRNTNSKEAEVIMDELENFLSWANRQYDSTGKSWSVIILSFYEKQRKYIRNILRSKYPENGNSKKETHFQIGNTHVYNYTVDKVQGREGDIVFLSMVQTERVGFMDSPNRLNVAITRARYQLVIIGRREYYAEQGSSFELRDLANRLYPPRPKNQNNMRG